MNFQDFLTAVEADTKALKAGAAPNGVTTCADCNVPLQESVTGNRVKADGAHLCSDCYFEAFGDELDQHPIRGLRVIRGA